ncbi:TonB-dependent receptor [Sphingomonas sp. LB3N6]|uniref:TonB-dependent receptor n=1 Tax=Sphingomonas fucosidasi TaxID=3096164 RepID=UPI002FC7AB7A
MKNIFRIQMLSASALTLVTLSGTVSAQVVAGQVASNVPTTPAPNSSVSGNAQVEVGVADESIMPGDIVVTAQKRVERLQDVPLAVTAVGGDMLASRQINDSNSLVQAVPSLTFQQGANPSNTTFRIRGIGTSLFSQGVEAAVSVVVDGVVVARQAQGFADFADIDRVEVLRGPQGTLFGRNATAGVINVVTARPSRELEGRADVTIAEGNEYRAKGTVSGPIGETLRARITGYYNHVGGITENVVTGREVNGSEGWGVRGKLEWDATDSLNFLLAADYRKNDSDCCASVAISLVNPVVAQLTAPVVASRRNRQIAEDVETFSNSNQKTFSLQGDWDLGSATLTSITAYQDYYLDVNQPIDRIDSDPVRFVGAGAAYAAWPVNGGQVDLKNFTQELRLGSNGSRDLTYVVGAYYSNLDIDRPYARRRAVCATGTIGQPCANPVFQSSSSRSHLDSESIAAFAQLEYRLVGGLKALGGIRVQHETVAVEGSRISPAVAGDAVFPASPVISGRRSTSDTAVTGKAGLQYEVSRNAQFYGSWTRGYKGPGFDTEISANFATQNPVEPETVDAYEIGFKGQSSDRKLSFAAALFRADYSNLQVQANRSDPVTGITQFVTTNAGSSRTQGFELEATLRPSAAFSVNASFTYAKATVAVDGLNCPLQFQAAANASTPITSGFPTNACFRSATVVNGATIISGPQQNVRGTLPASPRVRVSVTPRYDAEIGNTGLAGFVQTSINLTSKQNFSLEQDPLLVQPAYALVDMSVGVHDANNRYTVSVFVKNLFNENYLTNIAHNSLLATAANPFDLIANYNKDADRYFGAAFGLRF